MTSSRGRILIIDDAPLVRDALREYLATQGYTVETVSNGAEALTTVRGARPDLVLLDFRMPGMDGVEVLRRLHEIVVDLPVIMITADVEMAEGRSTRRLGAFDCVAKPFDLDRLGRVVEAAMLHTRGPSTPAP
jgi:CheY-like chemotaxis protein